MANIWKAMSSPFHFVESQEDDEVWGQREAASIPERSPMQGRPPLVAKTMRFAAPTSIPNVTAVLPTSPQSARRGVRTTPKARLRHDDSQIQFAAIESSPLVLEPVESQYLTDRQKEVQERQGREAAAMFPEIRSSPRSTSRTKEYSLPKLVFKPNQNEPSKSAAEDEISPIFPPDVLMNEFLGSSPTPSSSKKGGSNLQFVDGPPSSPPFVSSHLNIFQKIAPLLPQDANSAVHEGEQDHRSAGIENEAGPSANQIANEVEDQQANERSQNSADHPNEASVPEVPPIRSDERIFSDLDVYVDAPSEPTTAHPVMEQGENEVSHVTNSFQSQGSSRYDTEDDQVTAQLINEMERASSQQSQMLQAITKSELKSSKPGRKRKGIFEFPPSANKKAKLSTGSCSPQQLAETPKAGETVADCVMVDVREGPSNHAFSPVQIKIEGSPLPSVITASQFAEETSATKRGRGRPRKQARASQLSREASSLRKSPRQKQIKLELEDDIAMATISPAKDTRGRRVSRRSNPSSQQQQSNSRSQDHNSELDTDPLAPHADDDDIEGRLEGGTASQDSPARPTHHKPSGSNQREAASVTQHAEQNPPETAHLDETRGHTPTLQGILQNMKDVLDNIKRATLGREEERAVVSLLVDSIKEAHEAGRRSGNK